MRVTTDLQHYGDIANALRYMLGTSESVYPSQMASSVYSIRNYGGEVWRFVNHSISRVPSYVTVDGQSVPVTYVGDFAFAGCYDIKRISLPECTSVGNYAFYLCSAVSANLPICTHVGSSAFGDCRSLTTVSLPACVSLDAYAFQYCVRLTSVDLPSCTTVGSSAFYRCTTLASISLPVCETVGDDAFSNCYNLASIDLPACTHLGANAFHDCYDLERMSLPACTYVGSHAFAFCRSIRDINMSVCSYIGYQAFYGCSSLSVIFLTGVSSVTTIEYNTFGDVAGQVGIIVPASLLSDFRSAPWWSSMSSMILPLNHMHDTAYYDNGTVIINGEHASYANGIITTYTRYSDGVLSY